MVNTVVLIGRVGKEPEISNYKETTIAKFSLATSEKYKVGEEKKEKTQWHNIVFFGKLANIIEQYVKKGSQLYIQGKIDYSEYEKDGEKKYFTQVIGSQLQMLGSKKDDANNLPEPSKTNIESNQGSDDLPF